MRHTSLVVLLVAACGGGDARKDAALPRDTGPTADAPPLIGCTPRNGTEVTLREIGRIGTSAALLATSPPNDGRLFVVDRAGLIRIYENEQLKPQPFLDISDDIACCGERGLLGLAFHPNYAVNRQFYVYYTTDNANVVKRFYVSENDLNVADPAGEVILSIPDSASNHNGGMIEFGSDGYLYIGTGDIGGGGDPCRNAQEVDRNSSACQDPPGSCNVDTCEPLHGKILRIDVNTTDGGKNYGIPSDNPYAAGGGEPEIFIIGLRNPWRWSFDRDTGDMYIGDVGQDVDEELTILTPAQQNGANLGWSMYEGTRNYGNYTPDPSGVTMPQFTRPQSGSPPNGGWMSIIAGQVYRGSCFPDLVGYFFMTDYAARTLVRGRFDSGTFTTENLMQGPASPVSIHGDARGELFLTTEQGYVYQIEAGP